MLTRKRTTLLLSLYPIKKKKFQRRPRGQEESLGASPSMTISTAMLPRHHHLIVPQAQR
jgi:hypothetical protein